MHFIRVTLSIEADNIERRLVVGKSVDKVSQHCQYKLFLYKRFSHSHASLAHFSIEKYTPITITPGTPMREQSSILYSPT